MNRWYLLIHQLPPKPLYLRAKIRQRLDRVGAAPLKNSVYALPRTNECLDHLEGIAQEAVAGGGEAWVCEASFVEGTSREKLVALFRSQRQSDYAALAGEAKEALDALKKRSGTEPPEPEAAARLEKLKKRLTEIRSIDFFDAAGRKEAEAALRRLDTALRPRRKTAPVAGGEHADLAGRTWVTRRGIQVDRIATAWLVRRFVDRDARFRFVDPNAPAAPGEIRFDMMPADFTHEGDRCTFETLVLRLGIADPAVAEIAEIVHDVDLKDGKYARPDAAGIQRLLLGVVLSHPQDEQRLARGFALFDDLYQSFSRDAAAVSAGRKAKARPKGDRK
jgi:hypothetical protein